MPSTRDLNGVVADRFRGALSAQHISIKDYADQTGQSYDAAKRRVNGAIPITLSDLQDFCQVIGYKPSELIADEFVLKTPQEVE